MKWFMLVAFLSTIPIANWLIGSVGTKCIPAGPCLIPVGFGLLAPSGVLVIGAAFVLRDMVHERMGVAWAIAAILAGAAISVVITPPALAIASATAFLLAELADLGVYAPLRERRLALAVIASGIVGSVMDSAVFLLLAFGSLDFLAGQVVGKMWASLAAFGFLALRRWRMT